MKNNFLQIKKDRINLLFFCFSLIILTIPRSIETVAPGVYDIINAIKISIFLLVTFFVIKNKVKPSKFTKAFIIYSVYLLLITLLNKMSIFTFLKVYLLNAGTLLLCELIFNSKLRDKVIKYFADYNMILIILNCILVFASIFNGNPEGKILGTYLLGQDNRFILYILPTLISFYYLANNSEKKNNIKKMYIVYFIGLITLMKLWSLASFMILIFIGVLYIFFNLFKRIKINIYVIIAMLMIFCIALVFFDITEHFQYIIVEILHKSPSLSYRTIIWDRTINMLMESKVNLIFGFGYFDTSLLFTDIQRGLNHIHNIILDPLFAGGIVGLCLYFCVLKTIIKELHKAKKLIFGKVLIILFSSIFILLIFDTFEMYQIYYLLLYFIFEFANINITKETENAKKKEYDENYEIKGNPEVGILLATYNGEKYIKEQIDSIINQTYKNWTLYISDDNSIDKTMDIILKYKKTYKDKIVIIDNKNKLCSAKMNFANLFQKVDGHNYYMFCDQDDVWDENKILYLLRTMIQEEKNNNIPLLVYSDLKIVDSNLNVINNSLIRKENKLLPQKNLMNHILIENYFPGCVVMFNKKLKDKTKNIYIETEMHDWWLTLVACLTGKIIFVDKPLHLYRQHENNTIGATKEQNVFQKYFVRIKKIFDFEKTHSVWKNYQKIILCQSEELCKRYKKEENIDVINDFVQILKTKSKLKKLFLLIKKGYVPKEKIRILRMVI